MGGVLWGAGGPSPPPDPRLPIGQPCDCSRRSGGGLKEGMRDPPTPPSQLRRGAAVGGGEGGEALPTIFVVTPTYAR